MAISAGNICTYGELVQDALNRICNIAQNIDSFRNVPEEFQNGYSRIIHRHNFNTTVSWDGNGTEVKPVGTSASMKWTLNNHLCAVVPRATVEQQFNEFMTQRGIVQKSNTLMSFKGILNFYANLSAFCCGRLFSLTGQRNSAEVIFYDSTASGSDSFPPVSTNDSNIETTLDDLNVFASELIENLNRPSRVVNAIYTTNLSCCSSSSSSCSSSCSSSSSSSCSSSSSSSFFIAFMKLV